MKTCRRCGANASGDACPECKSEDLKDAAPTQPEKERVEDAVAIMENKPLKKQRREDAARKVEDAAVAFGEARTALREALKEVERLAQ